MTQLEFTEPVRTTLALPSESKDQMDKLYEITGGFPFGLATLRRKIEPSSSSLKLENNDKLKYFVTNGGDLVIMPTRVVVPDIKDLSTEEQREILGKAIAGYKGFLQDYDDANEAIHKHLEARKAKNLYCLNQSSSSVHQVLREYFPPVKLVKKQKPGKIVLFKLDDKRVKGHFTFKGETYVLLPWSPRFHYSSEFVINGEKFAVFACTISDAYYSCELLYEEVKPVVEVPPTPEPELPVVNISDLYRMYGNLPVEITGHKVHSDDPRLCWVHNCAVAFMGRDYEKYICSQFDNIIKELGAWAIDVDTAMKIQNQFIGLEHTVKTLDIAFKKIASLYPGRFTYDETNHSLEFIPYI